MTTLAASSSHGVGAHIAGYAVLALMLLVVFVGVMSIFSRRWRRIGVRAVCIPVGTFIALYAVGRGVAEFFVVHYSDPASYAKAWGGPSLAGVFAVHAGPGVAVLIGLGVWLRRRWVSRAHVSRVRNAGSSAGTAAGSPRRSQTTPCA